MLGLPSIAGQSGKEPRLPGLDVVIGTGFGQMAALESRSLKAQGRNAVPGLLYIAEPDLAAVDISNGGPYVVVRTTPHVSGRERLTEAAGRAGTAGKRLFGLFGSANLSHLPYRTADGRFDPAPDVDGRAESYSPSEIEEQPTLADMTRAALTVLSAQPGRPFALLVEAGDVDFALHKNNLDNAIGAVYSGEDAVQTVIKWVEQHSNWDESAMVITSGHGHYLVIDDLGALAGSAAPRKTR
jgi:alkaline phosphatase